MNWYTNLIDWIHHHGGYVSDCIGIEASNGTATGTAADGCILFNYDDDRKVVAKQKVSPGQVLVKIPFCLVIHGGSMPDTYTNKDRHPLDVDNNNNSSSNPPQVAHVHASSWLKCLATLLFHCQQQKEEEEEQNTASPSTLDHPESTLSATATTKTESDIHYAPYVQSLPTQYDSLIHSQYGWSDEDIHMYLGGTTLGSSILKDRTTNTLLTRFTNHIQPYWYQCPTIHSTLTFQDFLFATVVLCTRGFHSIPSSSWNRVSDETIHSDVPCQGPFLIPFIDLLNHTQDEQNKNVIMFLDHDNNDHDIHSSSSFQLVTTRHVEQGEEILHSYGDELNSSQLLQTFGFVSKQAIDDVLDTKMDDLKKNNSSRIHKTPAILTKQDLIDACIRVHQSSFPQELQSKILHHRVPRNELHTKNSYSDHNEDEEDIQQVWQLPSLSKLILRNQMISHLFQDHFLIIQSHVHDDDDDDNNDDYDDNNILSNEIITFCCFQFLDDITFQMLLPTNSNSSTTATTLPLLSSDILEDYYLGRLVYYALQDAVTRKLNAYPILEWDSVHQRIRLSTSSIPVPSYTTENYVIKLYNHNKKLLSFLMCHSQELSSNEKTEKNDMEELNNNNNNSTVLWSNQQQLFNVRKAIYGLTIQLEEQFHWKQLFMYCQASSSILQEDYMSTIRGEEEKYSKDVLQRSKKQRYI